MKKLISVLLVMALLVSCFYGCGSKYSEEDVDVILAEYMENVDEYETSTREFGEITSYIEIDNDIAIGIFYPETGIKTLDDALMKWIEDVTGEYNSDEYEEGELTISYDSYNVGNHTASIKMSGNFISPQIAHPVDIIKTFNVDTRNGKLLEIKDVFKEDKLNEFIEAAAEKFGVGMDAVDE